MNCRACGGRPEDHGPGKSQHVYTEREGELITHEQVAKAKRLQNQALMQAPHHPTMLDRLVEVLLNRGAIDRDEALYILAGVSPPAEVRVQ
jgi:hypothetical protein